MTLQEAWEIISSVCNQLTFNIPNLEAGIQLKQAIEVLKPVSIAPIDSSSAE